MEGEEKQSTNVLKQKALYGDAGLLEY